MTPEDLDKLVVLTDLADVVVSAVRERIVSDEDAKAQLELIFSETKLLLQKPLNLKQQSTSLDTMTPLSLLET
jgi:hypothetical protein